MPPIPQNTVDTLFVDYRFQDQEHSFQIHQRAGGPGPSMDDVALQFLQQLQPLMDPSWTVTGLRVRFAGSNVSLPAGSFAVTPGQGVILVGLLKPRFVSFVGRSATGVKSRLSIYGLVFTAEDDFRLEQGDIPALDAARAVLNTSNAVIGAVDGSALTWYPYYNTGWNAYHQRKARSG